MTQKVLLGTYTKRDSKGVYSIELDLNEKKLSNLQVEAEVGSPTYLAATENGERLYTVLKNGDKGGLNALKKTDDGSYATTDVFTQEGSSPCYVAYDSKRNFVYTANYHTGEVAVFKTDENGSLTLADSVQHSGKSVHENQKSAHAHYFDLTPDEKYLIACDLGTDEVVTYEVDEEGKLSEVDVISVAPGTGPRHIVFHPNGQFAYLFGELSSDVLALSYNSENGTLSHLQTISSIPEEHTEFNGGAAIRISNDGKYVYASNRGHDSIVVYSVKEDGTLELVEYVPTEGEIPRDFNIDPSGQFVVVGHQDTDNLTLFERDTETGKLSLLQKDVYAPEVVCVVFL
ncbi:lactonase family protein [Marinilactibacillus piezotolerans]|uniref:lactonase family protein n=1 Tax=Marinilactibacillus piezotolerans TaxID=258723 RepID=UPI0009B11A2A|nr:lactonase family protein [Marinilactibacillus piezotolerans]